MGIHSLSSCGPNTVPTDILRTPCPATLKRTKRNVSVEEIKYILEESCVPSLN